MYRENFYFKPIKPKLSDLELIAINISAEYLSINLEYQLFRYLSNSKLDGKIERSLYTRILSKIMTLTCIQFINVFVYKRNMNKIKIDIV
jgi:hypothetical protein